jgi:hypothetical protein
MIHSKKHILKKIISSVIVLLCLVSIGFFIYSADRYFKRHSEKLHEKTTFTDQEKNILWSELGLDYIDLDISKAYYTYYDRENNRNEKLYVVSEGFDSISAEIKYLKQFNGNENVRRGQEDYKIYDIAYNTDIDHSNLWIECTTYEENGKYYLKFYKNESEHSGIDNILNEVFGSDDADKE